MDGPQLSKRLAVSGLQNQQMRDIVEQELHELLFVYLTVPEEADLPHSDSVVCVKLEWSENFRFCGASYKYEELKPKIFLASHLLSRWEREDHVRRAVSQTQVLQGTKSIIFHCLNRAFSSLSEYRSWCQDNFTQVRS